MASRAPTRTTRALGLGLGLAAALTGIAIVAGGDSPSRGRGCPGVGGDLGDAPLAGRARARRPCARRAHRPDPTVGAGDVDADGAGPESISAGWSCAAARYVAPLGDGRIAVCTLNPCSSRGREGARPGDGAPRRDRRDRARRPGAGPGRPPDRDPDGGNAGIHDPSLALTTWAPAASVFKIVTAGALLEQGVKPSTRVCYHGGVRSVTESNLEDDRHDRACQDLSYGLAHSQNAILAKLAHQHLAPTDLAGVAAASASAGRCRCRPRPPSPGRGPARGPGDGPDRRGVPRGRAVDHRRRDAAPRPSPRAASRSSPG